MIGIGILNYLCFYGGWFACIYAGSSHRTWIAYTSALAIVALFFYLSKHKKAFVLVLFLALFSGFILDSSFKHFEWIHYETSPGFGAPIWILSLYAIFATSIDSSLNWLKHRLWLASILGFVGGPLSYRAGSLLGAITFLQAPHLIYLTVGIFWAFFLPALLYAYTMCDKTNVIYKS